MGLILAIGAGKEQAANQLAGTAGPCPGSVPIPGTTIPAPPVPGPQAGQQKPQPSPPASAGLLGEALLPHGHHEHPGSCWLLPG